MPLRDDTVSYHTQKPYDNLQKDFFGDYTAKLQKLESNLVKRNGMKHDVKTTGDISYSVIGGLSVPKYLQGTLLYNNVNPPQAVVAVPQLLEKPEFTNRTPLLLPRSVINNTITPDISPKAALKPNSMPANVRKSSIM